MDAVKSFLDLPSEVIECILIHVHPRDLPACCLVNHFLHEVATNSIFIQYIIALYTASAVGNPNSSLSIVERRERLKVREESWYNLAPTSRHTIKCSGFSTGGLYDLSNGIYVLGDVSRTLLHYVYLSDTSSVAKWHRFDPKDSRRIVDFGLSINEHDLIAVITWFVFLLLLPSLGTF